MNIITIPTGKKIKVQIYKKLKNLLISLIFTKNEISMGITIKFHKISRNIPKSKNVLNLLFGLIIGIIFSNFKNLKNPFFIDC